MQQFYTSRDGFDTLSTQYSQNIAISISIRYCASQSSFETKPQLFGKRGLKLLRRSEVTMTVFENSLSVGTDVAGNARTALQTYDSDGKHQGCNIVNALFNVP